MTVRVPEATRNGSRGVSAVEFALLAPLLALIFVGIVDFGVLYRDHVSLRQGGREGARQIARDYIGNDSSCFSSLTGDFVSASPQERRAACLIKDRADVDDGTDTRVAIHFEGGTHEKGKFVTVCVAFPADSTTGFFSPLLDDRTITTRTRMRVETDPAVQLSSGLEETYPGTGDWSWCNANP